MTWDKTSTYSEFPHIATPRITLWTYCHILTRIFHSLGQFIETNISFLSSATHHGMHVFFIYPTKTQCC